LLGHKLLRCYPYVPIGGELGVNVAILSYNGVAYVGFGGDVTAVPDIELFENMLRESFAELREAATTIATVKKQDAARKRGRSKPIPTAVSKEVASRPAIRKIPVSVRAKSNGRAATSVPPRTQKDASPTEGTVPALAQTGD